MQNPSICAIRIVDTTPHSYQELLSPPSTLESISFKQKAYWGLNACVYLGALIFNFTSQDNNSWEKYAFRLTQIGAWLTLIQHVLHPHSPLRPPIIKLADRCRIGTGRWPCLRNDTYTHSEGLSNLSLSLEALIPIMFWSLGLAVTDTHTVKIKAKNAVNAILMHGGISLTLFLDYFINERKFHLRHTLVNLAIFMGLYTAWNYLGQRINPDSEPVYPALDWFNDPMNILYASGFALAASLIITGLLKVATHLRRRECPHICTFLRTREDHTEVRPSVDAGQTTNS